MLWKSRQGACVWWGRGKEISSHTRGWQKKRKRLSPINLTSYPFARKETFFRVFGQEGEEEFLSSIRNNRLPRDASTKFQDTWFVKKIFLPSIFPIYTDETLEENYLKQIIVVSSIKRPRHTTTPLLNRVFGQEREEEFLSSIEITGYHASTKF